MRSWNPRQAVLGLSVALAGGLFATAAMAQPPGRGPKEGTPKTVRGTVREFTTGRQGEVNGMILSEGTEVHWPPHLTDKVKAGLGLKDRVKVTGWLRVTKGGDTHLHASAIANLSNDRTITVDENRNPPPPPPPPRGRGKKGRRRPRDEQPKTVTGSVREFTTAPRGEVDGMMLSDGTEVHWPPHLGDRMKDFLARKDRVRVQGWLHTTPRGDVHLRAGTITNLRTDKSVTVDDRPPEAGVGRAAPGDVEQRLQALEEKLDRVTQLLERQRRDK